VLEASKIRGNLHEVDPGATISPKLSYVLKLMRASCSKIRGVSLLQSSFQEYLHIVEYSVAVMVYLNVWGE
jgi:hypothetical protein